MMHPQAERQDDPVFIIDHAAIRKLENRGGFLLAIAILFALVGAWILFNTIIYWHSASFVMLGIGASMFYPLGSFLRLRTAMQHAKSDGNPAALLQARRHLKQGFVFAGVVTGIIIIIVGALFIWLTSGGGFHR